MTTVLQINASGTIAGSATRDATERLLADLNPSSVITRDLSAEPLPQINADWINARLIPQEALGDDGRAVLALSDKLITEIKAADIVLIGMPMYNFGMPASLKLWVDLIARPKVTFTYTENGPVGLMTGKRAVVAVSSGGVPIGSAADFATPHLTQILKFIGIDEIAIKNAKDIVPALAA
jgi:FMN-dependent NADH-azoreductase